MQGIWSVVIPIICVVIGWCLGRFSGTNSFCWLAYSDMKDLVHSYTDLNVQLINAVQHKLPLLPKQQQQQTKLVASEEDDGSLEQLLESLDYSVTGGNP